MKKTDVAFMKKGRRKTTKDVSLLKKFREHDSRETSKDTIQTITVKLVSEASSPWHGAELLYIIQTQRRTRRANKQDPSSRDDSASSKSSSSQDRYLAMLRKKDSSQNISIIRVQLKDGDVEIKNTFDLSSLRSVDFGSDDNELLISYDNADHNLYFNTQNERDETLWIIIQVCKHIVRNDITVGYSIDIDALTYITTSNGTLSRFPLLQKMVQQHTKELGDYFSKEETEAETLLDELNWVASLQEHTNLQQTLSGQAEKLSDEIIDFLLQWEEMDLNTKSKNNANNNTASTGAGKNSNVNSGKNGLGKLGGVSDTSEVLQALSQVDLELEAVDMWLGEQIGRLEEVQANLHMIEDESGALESSWQSLLSVQEVVTLLVTRYSLDPRYEDMLLHPDKVMGPILKGTLVKVEAALAPMIDAMTSVHAALRSKFADIADITPAQWKQLQNMTSIASQKAKLSDIADSCCESFTEYALTLFDFLLKHKTLLDAGVVVKQFFFTEVMYEPFPRSKVISFTTVPVWFSKIHLPQHNGLMKAVLVYQANIQPFIPLLHIFTELAPQNIQPIQEAYLKASVELLYKPLFKTLAQNLLSLCTTKHTLVTLQNVGKYKLKDKMVVLPLTYNKSTPAAAAAASGGAVGALSSVVSGAGASSTNPSQNNSLSPWMAFRVALMMVVPVLEQEEIFIDSFFRMGTSAEYVELASPERHQAMLCYMFDHLVSKFEVAIGVRSANNVLPVPGSVVGSFTGGAGNTSGGGASGGGKEGMFVMNASVHSDTASSKYDKFSLPSTIPATSSSTNTSSSSSGAITNTDGIAAIAMLAVLTEFEVSYREAMVVQFANNMSGINAPANGNRAGAPALPVPVARHARFSFLGASIINSDGTAVPTARSDEEALNLYLDLYLVRCLDNTRLALLQRIQAYASDTVAYIRAQKADAKLAEVLAPFACFPTWVAQVLEMCNGKHFECVDELLVRVCKELFNWMNTVANQNEKYADKMKITNYGYFLMVIPPMQVEILESFVSNAIQVRQESMIKYVNWMVAYEFPALSALAIRLDGVGKKVHDEELSLYIRRKDVLNVVKELELKSLENMVITMRKRLLKHFKSDMDAELRLVDKTWQQLKDRVVTILGRLEEAASLSYQIKLEVGPDVLSNFFDRVAGDRSASERGPVGGVLSLDFSRHSSTKGAALDGSKHSSGGLDFSRHSTS